MRVVRKDLPIQQLQWLLEQPFNATLATYRKDGSVLLSPVWHEWRDGGFSIFTGLTDVKLRHIERHGQAVAIVSDNAAPYGGVEVTAAPTLVSDQALIRATCERIVRRYLGAAGEAYLARFKFGELVLIRLVPGRLRAWDFADDAILSVATTGEG
jgi:PPOX class probable F420-dependent enzyme